MAFTSEFIPLPLSELRREAAVCKADGWRFMQTHAVSTDTGVDLYYSFMKDGLARNYRIEGITPDQPVPSITDLFLAAFVFENEARELFGVDMHDIVIDFQGAMYAPVDEAPMTFLTPEQKAARDKARAKAAKATAAKPAKSSDSAGQARESAGVASDAPSASAVDGGADAGSAGSDIEAAGTSAPRVFVMTPEKQARLDAKLATMSADKVEKVKAALAARKAEAESAAANAGGSAVAAKTAPESTAAPKPAEKVSSPATSQKVGSAAAQLAKTPVAQPAPQHDEALESALSLLDADKAAKVRAALAGKAGIQLEPGSETGAEESPAAMIADEQVAKLLDEMDSAKAAKVRAALASKGGE